MSIEVSVEPAPEEKIVVSTPFPDSRWGKIAYGLFMVVMPILAFWATDLFKPEWQTGEFSDYLILLLFPEASLLFFLLVVYSIICYILLLIDATRYSRMFFARMGVYTGVLLAFQYTFLSGLFFFSDSNNTWSVIYLLGLWVLPIAFPRIYHLLIKKWDAKAVKTVLWMFAIAFFLVSALVGRSPLLPLVLLLAGMTVASPFWCFLIMLRAAIWLIKDHESAFTVPRGLGSAAWIAGYVAAWRFDILKMYELYAALPPQPPPDCYIATAAAQGHSLVVGSWLVRLSNGETMCVNKQLQILKCAELALLAAQPGFHRILRRAYDVIGKALAKRIRNPYLADLAYLLLKPWAWLARFVLRMMIPEIDLISKKMYTD
jgi:hypothetical protein